MKKTSLLRDLYLRWLSQPAAERTIYRQIQQTAANAVVEFGVGDGVRSRRIIAALLRRHPAGDVYYTGIDLFEARPASVSGLTLKAAHRLLAETGVHVRLVPGDPFSALARSANALTGTDLVVVGAEMDPAAMDDAWFYLPRMLHQQSRLLLASGKAGAYQLLSRDEVEERAARTGRRAA